MGEIPTLQFDGYYWMVDPRPTDKEPMFQLVRNAQGVLNCQELEDRVKNWMLRALKDGNGCVLGFAVVDDFDSEEWRWGTYKIVKGVFIHSRRGARYSGMTLS